MKPVFSQCLFSWTYGLSREQRMKKTRDTYWIDCWCSEVTLDDDDETFETIFAEILRVGGETKITILYI